jgi:S-adenosylmethionine hydrolase
MSIVSFTVERRYRKFLLAGLKAKLLSEYPENKLLTISDEITSFNTLEAAYVLQSAYRYFPKGTIHLVFVEHLIDAETPPLLLEYDGHYFITADNGFITLFLDILHDSKSLPAEVYRLKDFEMTTPFDDIDFYYQMISGLLKKEPLQSRFEKTATYRQLFVPKVVMAEDNQSMEGKILFFDSYGNVVTNIRRTDFELFSSEHFSIRLQFYPREIRKINRFYKEQEPGELFAIFNQQDFLEIGIFKDSAKEMLSLEIGQSVDVKKE